MDDSPEAKEARERLVLGIQAAGEPWDQSGPWDPKVLAALRLVPRHLFMPGTTLRRAYADQPNPIGYGQTISQPTVVAIMTDALDLKGSERVLEIGTGSGYQAAVLSVLVRDVFTIEIVRELGESARARLSELGYKNVEVRVGDGYQGWPEHAPFDRVLLTAAPPEIPKALVDQLRDGGILVAPVGEDGELQRLVRWRKVGGILQKEDLGSVRFVPMVPSPR
jgi:protein-L-isoaspartate(D-aspartate) O-methyltransferase